MGRKEGMEEGSSEVNWEKGLVPLRDLIDIELAWGCVLKRWMGRG
jgi:hypothetical protein